MSEDLLAGSSANTDQTEQSPSTYADTGVSIEAGDEAVDRMRPWAQRATRPEVLGSLGGFAGLFQLKLDRWSEPVLASSTDGVGTKLAIAQALDVHDTVGIDLVAMVVDDLVVCGAEPLFLQDYIATGQVAPERVSDLVKGISEGCVQAGCALLGGETAEHPGMMASDEYDISATGVGVVEADAMLGPEKVRPGDVVIGMGSTGLHSNGYSLARHVLLDVARMPLSGHVEEFGRTLGEELLEPTRVYAKDCLALAAETEVRTFAHVTGGGLAGNLERVIPQGLTAVLDRATWTPAPVFRLIAQRGRVEAAEMERTFNMGIGMVAVVTAEDVDRALAVLTARHVPAWVLGEVAKQPTVAEAGEDQRVVLHGDHPRF
ncbi:phosphoribosylformylglycinamidine cyclo-ligase [Halopolyspora algeriensis]|uniref:Phosphoribosylformylglycinamidine cyclo-ligase n=1 Tax=Halopolyspora algeriensis TaxID=1500506 RepID=A0A368W2Z3_9ACTN|nr:phosphoribosylformylglycinamidine cyclo-ligase [Halopolyspora algeriensis]RCW47053.1 phosphoribosylformylglycinamidine cyclo-ligase [Halopolyspora algeriensis]TQM48140.1 phosphoribosylformylglycinamidine cyclo-ligase [Halopolyspora algeriensis]